MAHSGTDNVLSLLKIFLYAQWRQLQMLVDVPRALFDHGLVAVPKRVLIFIVVLPLLWLLTLVHFLGFLIDALVFPSWRRQEIIKPVFIVGVPRSGTTFLHRYLAQDPRFSTTPTWEVLLAPAICEKHFWRFMIRLCAPMFKAAKGLAPGFFKRMNSVHELGLNEAEEDFLFLLSVNACFILVALLPRSEHIWRLATFDSDLPDWERELILNFYQMCVAKHLYFQARVSADKERIYLAKNPSFSPWVKSLAQRFDDARFIICMREPEVVLPSQIRSLMPAFSLLGSGRAPECFRARCIEMFSYYFRHLVKFKQAKQGVPLVMNETLRYQLPEVLVEIYQYLQISEHAHMLERARDLVSKVEPSRASEDYNLAELDLNTQQIKNAFKDVWPIHV